VGDTIEEPSEGFIAALSNPSDGASLGGRTTCVITLLNDDGPSAAVAADAAAMIKPNGTGDSGPCGIGGASSALGLAAFALFLRRRRR
jgi:MYXO-CTERM domain-containing protein